MSDSHTQIKPGEIGMFVLLVFLDITLTAQGGKQQLFAGGRTLAAPKRRWQQSE
jgi:hypothetical protein